MTMMVADRIAGAANLAAALKARMVRKGDIDTIDTLISAEVESLERSQTIADQTSYAASYRAGQKVAAENSQAIIELLEQAMEAATASQTRDTADLLEQAALYRVNKREQRRKASPRSISALYTEYQAHHDEGFHAWLKQQGHTEALASIKPKQQAKPARRRRTS